MYLDACNRCKKNRGNRKIEKMSRRFEESEFLSLFGETYGYSGEIKRIRKQEFSRLEGITYLDHAGATQYPQSVVKNIYNDFTNNVYGNPHSRNPSSQLARDLIEQVRSRILRHFNTNEENHSVIFTAGATDALRLLADNFAWQGPVINGNCHHRSCFCYLEENHTSVVGIREKAAKSGVDVICLNENDVMTSKEDSHLRRTFHSSSGGRVEQHRNCCCSLFAYPAMCNFSGTKYPLEWVSQSQQGLLLSKYSSSCDWFVVLDAASLVSTSPLDLASCTADFVPVSFYKMFGFPTGLGALIVRNKSSYALRKCYYGGGTVQATISGEMFHVLKENLAEKFEDGTLPYLDIIGLNHAFSVFEKLTGCMTAVLNHTHSIALYTYNNMSAMKHLSGQPLCKIYCKTDFKDKTRQGPIINFNLLRTNGDFVGYSEVEKMASLYNIHLRTGCFCNTGACQQFLNLSNEQIKSNLSAGHACGDDVDLIDGKPTGSVRISFGYMSNFADARTFLTFLCECFLERAPNGMRQSSTADIGLSGVQGTNMRDENTETKTLATMLPQVGLTSNATESADCHTNGTLEDRMLPNNPENDLPLGPNNSLLGSVTTMEFEEDYKIGSSFNNGLRLEQICLYPIKSCAAFKVNEWEVDHQGFVYDRHWMIIAESGICLTQKREPRLCLIIPTLDLVNGVLTVAAPGMACLVLPLSSSSKEQAVNRQPSLCHSKVCGDRVSGRDCGEEAARWISIFLNRNCRVIEQQDGRTCKLEENKVENGSSSLSLANESQFLLITRASTGDLLMNIKPALASAQQRAESEPNHMDGLIDRFRANLIVNGHKPFSEDDWRVIKIGNLVFKSQGKCNRCQMVCVDQETGMRSVEPLKSLGKLRGSRMPFGIHLQHVVSGGNPFILRCGDEVTVCDLALRIPVYNEFIRT